MDAKNITHPELVRALVKPPAKIVEEWIRSPHKANITHMALGICGEAGELLDCIKKYTIYNQAIDLENLKEELGDIEFYLEGLRQAFNISRESTLTGNVQKLLRRYDKVSYSDEHARERKDKC